LSMEIQLVSSFNITKSACDDGVDLGARIRSAETAALDSYKAVAAKGCD